MVAAGFIPIKVLDGIMAISFNFKADACSLSSKLNCTVRFST